MNEATGSYAPVVLLLSNGNYTDDWERPLSVLKNNNWFKPAIKAAIAVGDDANIDSLAEFTGSKDAVIKLQPNIIRLLIKEAINSILIQLERPVDREDKDENERQTIFNSRIKSYQKENQDSGEDKCDFINTSTYIKNESIKNDKSLDKNLDDDWV